MQTSHSKERSKPSAAVCCGFSHLVLSLRTNLSFVSFYLSQFALVEAGPPFAHFQLELGSTAALMVMVTQR